MLEHIDYTVKFTDTHPHSWWWLLCFLSQLVCIYSGENADILERNGHGRVYEFEPAQFCPTEYLHEVSYFSSMEGNNNETGHRVTAKKQQFTEVGQTVTMTCDPESPDWKSFQKSNPGQFFLFPSSIRRCNPDGIWSQPPPICVNTDSMLSDESVTFKSVEACHASGQENLKCSKSLEDWVPVGNAVQSKCALKDKTNSSTGEISFGWIIRFHRSHFLSFLTLNFQGEFASINVCVKRDSLIDNFLSDYARNFLNKHYATASKLARYKTKSEDACPIVQLSAYTDEIIVTVATSDKNLQKTLDSITSDSSAINVYPVIERKKPKRYRSEQEKRLCPKSPIIPNAIKVSNINETHFQNYTCANGYVLFDPVTNFASHGTLECIDGSWAPYPFPVCRRLKEVPDGNRTANEKPPFLFSLPFLLLFGLFLLGCSGAITILYLACKHRIHFKSLSPAKKYLRHDYDYPVFLN